MPAATAPNNLASPRSHAPRRATTASAAREKREHAKLIRFTAAELHRVAERARLAGRPVACYIREASLGPAPRVRPTGFSDSVIRTLARLATSLPHLAQQAREHRLATGTDFDAAVDDVLTLIRELD